MAYSEPSTRQKLQLVRRLTSLTQAGKVIWEESGAEGGVFKAVAQEANASVVLDSVGEGSDVRYRLRSSPVGTTSFDLTIEQVVVAGEPYPEDQELDALLAFLHQLASRRSRRDATSLERMIQQFE